MDPPRRGGQIGATSGGARRRVALLLVAVALLAIPALLPAPAAAHAVLLDASPEDGAQLEHPPEHVTLTFNEPVEPGLGGLRVLDSTGARVDDGGIFQPVPEQVRVSLPADLDDGTFLASYRIISADGHVVTGAVVFAVGVDLDFEAVRGLGEQEGSAVAAVGVAGRSLAYGGALLAAGLAFFLSFVHDRGGDQHRLWRMIRPSCLVSAVGALLALSYQGAVATGRGLDAVSDGVVLRTLLQQGGIGWALAAQLSGLALLYSATVLREGTAQSSLAFYGAIIAVGSFALTGHTADADPRLVVTTVDILHLAVAALWTGGLVGLASTLRARRRAARQRGDDDGARDTALVVVRFSAAAAVSVAVLATTGGILAWNYLSTPGDLVGSDYGRTLLLKLLVLVAVLAVAAWNRWWLVPQLLAAGGTEGAAGAGGAGGADGGGPGDGGADGEPAGDARPTDDARAPSALADDRGGIALPTGAGDDDASGDGPPAADPPGDGPPGDGPPGDGAGGADGTQPRWDRLVRTSRLELAGLVLVLVVTAALVNTRPPDIAAMGAGPFDRTVAVTDTLDVNVVVVPAETGPNDVHISYLENGTAADGVESATVTVALPDAEVDPIAVPARPAGPGHFIATTDALAVSGTWELELTARVDGFTQERVTLDVPIADP